MAYRAVPLEAGERDRLITIQQLTERTRDSGFPAEDWTTLCSMYASKKERTAGRGGRERFAANQESAPYDTVWEMNYRKDMDPDLLDVCKTRRVVYQGRVMDIVSASMIGRLEGLELTTLSRNG